MDIQYATECNPVAPRTVAGSPGRARMTRASGMDADGAGAPVTRAAICPATHRSRANANAPAMTPSVRLVRVSEPE